MQGSEKQKENSKKTKDEIPFFKKVLISIKDFEKYEMFAKENVGQAVLYLVKIMAIFSVLITILSLCTFSKNLSNVMKKFDENVDSLSYAEGIVTINNNEKTEINDFDDSIGMVIIDTSELNDEQLQQYKKDINERGAGAIILRDKVIIINQKISALAESDYDTMLKTYNIESLDKQTILDYYNKNYVSIYIAITLLMFAYMFAIYTINVLIDCLMLAVLAFFTSRIVRLKMKFSASFNIAVHALTLPLVLNMIYIVLNFFTGITIKYFQVMYTTIAYIYIITAILMIKSDYIKNQMEVQKIVSEQEKVKEEIKEKQENEKNEREKEEVKKRDKQKEKKEEGPFPRIGNKPEGDNA